ncbi:MAG: glycosyl hydrolase, partial [Ferruginibacter sp.]|nr:glycosyl hydrolase [Ferruginibacter sp.]
MKRNFLKLLTLSCILFGNASVSAQSSAAKTEQKIQGIIKQLTLDEKIALLHANSIFGTAGVARLNIPGLMTDDGPLGVREDLKEGWAPANLTTDSATFFPNGSA